MAKNQRTTPATRKLIRESSKTAQELAQELDISLETVRKWRARESEADLSHRPHRLRTTLTPCQEEVIAMVRQLLQVPLDDLLGLATTYLHPEVSRSGLSRCLTRQGVGKLSPAADIPGQLRLHGLDVAAWGSPGHLLIACDATSRWLAAQLVDVVGATAMQLFVAKIQASYPGILRGLQTTPALLELLPESAMDYSVMEEAAQMPSPKLHPAEEDHIVCEPWQAGLADTQAKLDALLTHYNETMALRCLKGSTPRQAAAAAGLSANAPSEQPKPQQGLSHGHLKKLLGFSLRLAQVRTFRDFESALSDFKLSPAQFSLLDLLYHNHGPSQAQIAEMLEIDRSSLVPMLDRLEERGALERRASREDRRHNHLHLTDAGRTLYQASLQKVLLHEAHITAGFSQDEIGLLMHLLERVARERL